MRAAATLLSSSTSLSGLAGILSATGLASDPVQLEPGLRESLGVDHGRRLELAAGIGALRVLLIELAGDGDFRDSLRQVAHRLGSRAPHVLWLVGAVDGTGTRAAILGWHANAPRQRIVSFLWETAHVVDSDAETLCALAAARGDEDVLVHARILEVLGREALTRRFYRTLEAQVGSLAETLPRSLPADDARRVALLYASRLLFLSFLEAKGWLDGDRGFIAARFDDCMRTGGQFHRRVLLPLFFGTLNTPRSRRARVAQGFGRVPFLNGGLFTRTPLERRADAWRFPDDRIGGMLEQLFQRYRFVAREDTATWSEASVDPEMLGRAFESLMAGAERKAGGVYYTPHALVSRVAERALSASAECATLDGVRELRVLDPACGSGAFLVFVLERLTELRRSHGDRGSVAAVRRDVLARSIFGVDRNPTAVWLCELRLWLSVVIESEEDDPQRVPPLPNLDRNIRVGDALTGPGLVPDQGAIVGSAHLTRLRQRYVRATGSRKRQLARALDREERRRVVDQLDRDIEATRYARREALNAQRARDLFGERSAPGADARRGLRALRDRLRTLRAERRRVLDAGALPFSFGACFADTQARGGFDVVLGNPPWVRLHRIPAALRLQLKRGYEVYRAASWQAGASGARAAPGFASQVDLAALFVERSLALLRRDGIVSLLLPAKLWRSLAGGGLRDCLTRRSCLLRLEDLSESKHAFDAAVYPSLLVARASDPAAQDPVLVVHGRADDQEWTIPRARLAFDRSPGSPWIMLTPMARAAFDVVCGAGSPLASSRFGAPRLGVKSGCNAAFVVRVTDTTRSFARIVSADGEAGSVELELLRPALRGDAVSPWVRSSCDEWVIWTHDERGAPLPRLPARAREWLQRHYGQLAARSDAAHARRWWSLFRVDAANAGTSRVVWSDIGRRPRALVLQPGDPTVPLNTCYVLPCADPCDAWALAALLNSRLARAWLNVLAEPARGGYRRYLGWTVGQLPLPKDWDRARAELAAARGQDDERLLDAALAAFRLGRADVSALLDWEGQP